MRWFKDLSDARRDAKLRPLGEQLDDAGYASRLPSRDRSLPHSLDAEKALLGGLILGGDGSDLCLAASDFFLPRHRLLFQLIREMHRKSLPVDLVTISEKLKQRGELDAAGGSAYLASLVDGVPRMSNLEAYGTIIREKAIRRQLIRRAHEIEEAAVNGQPLAELLARTEKMLSGHLGLGVGTNPTLAFRSAAEISASSPAEVQWIAPPYLAAGAIMEISGKVKAAGKTTFVMHQARAVLDGGEFLGEPTMRSAVVYLTEQTQSSFSVTLERAGLVGHPDLWVLYWNQTIGLSWPEIAEAARLECKRRGAQLLVVDTVGQFAGLEGDSENNAGDAFTAMRPLQLAAAEGIGVVTIRHERKAGGKVGDSGRGSSAYGGTVDTLLSLRRPEGNHKPTIRTLAAISRFDGVPDELVVELTPDGYVSLGRAADVAFKEGEDVILAAVPTSEEEALTLGDLIEGSGVARSTARRAAKALISAGRLKRTGTGRKGQPFRYFLDSGQTSSFDGPNEPGGAWGS